MSAERGQRPDVSTDQGRLDFIKILNTRLPKKRTIAQGMLRNEHGDLLLCQLTYKREWDLPGGVVDPDESPATCVQREVREELGIVAEKKDGETVVFAFAVYKNRKHRDEVMKKVMADPDMKYDPAKMPFDGKRMIFGGFETVVLLEK